MAATSQPRFQIIFAAALIERLKRTYWYRNNFWFQKIFRNWLSKIY